MRVPEPRCEQCYYYHMIDSGYGDCYRYPPKIVVVKLGYEYLRMCVAWYDSVCGEFIRR